MVAIGRRYSSIVLMVLVASTAATYSVWLLRRGDPVEVLILEAPESLFASVQVPRTVSVAVSPQRDLESLEFRFRCLLERPIPGKLAELGPDATATALLEACPAISSRLDYIRSIGAEDYVAIREAPLTGRDERTILLADFASVMSVLLEGDQSNQSYTTFAIMLNGTRHVVAYFEGFAELFTAQEHMLELVTVESGGVTAEYHASPKAGQSSITELASPYGVVQCERPKKGEIEGVTMVLKSRKTSIPGRIYEVKIAAASYLEVAEIYVDGKYVEGASGYWRIFHGDAPEEG